MSGTLDTARKFTEEHPHCTDCSDPICQRFQAKVMAAFARRAVVEELRRRSGKVRFWQSTLGHDLEFTAETVAKWLDDGADEIEREGA